MHCQCPFAGKPRSLINVKASFDTINHRDYYVKQDRPQGLLGPSVLTVYRTLGIDLNEHREPRYQICQYTEG